MQRCSSLNPSSNPKFSLVQGWPTSQKLTAIFLTVCTAKSHIIHISTHEHHPISSSRHVARNLQWGGGCFGGQWETGGQWGLPLFFGDVVFWRSWRPAGGLGAKHPAVREPQAQKLGPHARKFCIFLQK